MPQIRQVVSEALQSTVRRLLPSQQGFTEDLMATNVITPIIDLTPSAEGDTLPTDLARSLAFGSQTAFNVDNGTSVVANNAGFTRIQGVSTVYAGGATSPQYNEILLSDGLSTKVVWAHSMQFNLINAFTSISFDLIVFLDAGESMSVRSDANCRIIGSTRQVADVNGEIVNPSGYSPS
jgi:hypothetical protein